MARANNGFMASRVEPGDSLEDFPTQPWATRALLRHVLLDGAPDDEVWEPCCNRGYMAHPLKEHFRNVRTTDIMHYGYPGTEVEDFLKPDFHRRQVDWVITNPPFRHAEAFVRKALRVSRKGVAFFVRSSFAEGVGRYEKIFQPLRPAVIAQFSERVPLVKGRVDRRASTAATYAWFVWRTDHPTSETVFRWIPPCRRQLEKDTDYPASEIMGVTLNAQPVRVRTRKAA